MTEVLTCAKTCSGGTVQTVHHSTQSQSSSPRFLETQNKTRILVPQTTLYRPSRNTLSLQRRQETLPYLPPPTYSLFSLEELHMLLENLLSPIKEACGFNFHTFKTIYSSFFWQARLSVHFKAPYRNCLDILFLFFLSPHFLTPSPVTQLLSHNPDSDPSTILSDFDYS